MHVGWQRGRTRLGVALLVVATNLAYFSIHVLAYSIGEPNVEGKSICLRSPPATRGLPLRVVSAAFPPT